LGCWAWDVNFMYRAPNQMVNHLCLPTRPGKQTKLAIEHGPVEIVDLPIKNCDFP
jgi:hypothetical protein